MGLSRLVKYSALTIVCVLCALAYAYSHIVHAMLMPVSGFVQFESGLYVSDRLDKAGQDRFRALLAEAKARVAQTYGAISATPVTIVAQGMEEASRYGLGESPGTLFTTPWQQYLVLNNQKLTGADVIAHELMHAELGERVGYVKRMLQTIENYSAAKKAVADLFEEEGSSALYETLSSIESGQAFGEVVGVGRD